MSELCPPCGTSGSPSMGPYQRHYYRLGSVIRNTVSQAQDTLCGIWKHQFCDGLRSARDYFDGLCREQYIHMNNPETGETLWTAIQKPGPPQSLGELCIEIEQHSMESAMSTERRWKGLFTVKPFIDTSRRDIQELRKTMYHKHTSLRKERKTARLERLIELVRNA